MSFFSFSSQDRPRVERCGALRALTKAAVPDPDRRWREIAESARELRDDATAQEFGLATADRELLEVPGRVLPPPTARRSAGVDAALLLPLCPCRHLLWVTPFTDAASPPAACDSADGVPIWKAQNAQQRRVGLGRCSVLRERGGAPLGARTTQHNTLQTTQTCVPPDTTE